ncbi:hypothetical protein Csa_004910 [Cucumis sativus]|nr:hypothetical protein Csa_004910 [Cucumis sativus]
MLVYTNLANPEWKSCTMVTHICHQKMTINIDWLRNSKKSKYILHPFIQRKPTKSIISINSSCNEVKGLKRWRAFPSCIQIQSHHIND